MAKCASCRVRHLSCDALPICNECTKSGRECSRLNVRFKHLVCPSKEHDCADYSKYEFFFSGEQTWVDIEGKTEFVDGIIKGTVDTALIVGLEDRNIGTTDRYSELRLDTLEPPSSAWADASISQAPASQIAIPDNKPPDYLAATEQGISLYGDLSRYIVTFLDKFSGEVSQYTGNESINTKGAYSGKALQAPDPAYPLQSVRERRLFQHFISHLAPWVSSDSPRKVWGSADSASSMWAITIGTSAKSQPVWQQQALY